ncbi:MAG: transporter substrate-binding domain-containing protein [Planctomycetes bacterium]|nr:transporter substrate-binding domain-containing protein [Planctomycetota bacterium]
MRRLLLPLLALTLTACPGAGPAADALDKVKARGKLIVAMDVGYDPFEVLDPDAGTPVGYDVDLVQAFAKHLGVEVEYKNVAWNSIVGVLQTGKADVIVSGMSVTPERQKTIDFSRPYYYVGQVVVKRKGDARIKGLADLNEKGMIVAVQESTTGEQAVRENAPEAELLRFAKTDMACMAVIQEKADAVVFDRPYLEKYVRDQRPDELEGIWEPFTAEAIAAAFRKDSGLLRQAFDATIEELAASGELDALVAKHFGEAAVADQQAKRAAAPAQAPAPAEDPAPAETGK